MGIATAFSLILIAAGAILTFAVTATVSGVDLAVVGVILMIVGGIGLLLALLFLATWAPFHTVVYRNARRRDVDEVVHDA